jgi:catechol 2,3-dioxygenase
VIIRLAHVELGVDDLDAAKRFYVDLLGFRHAGEDDDQLRLGAAEEFDAWSLALTEVGAPGLLHFAFRVETEEELQELASLHDRLGMPNVLLPPGAESNQGAALRVRAQDGHVIEFFHVFDERDDVGDHEGVRLPMRQTHRIGGIPPTRIDHINLRVRDMQHALRYWQGELGFSLSEQYVDRNGDPLGAWLRRRRASHDLAIGQGREAALHHVAYHVGDPSGPLRVADLLGDARVADHIEFGPCRHGVGNALTIYIRDPAGNRLEFYTGDYERDLDRPPLTWTESEYERQGRDWWGSRPPATFHDQLGRVHDLRAPEPRTGVAPTAPSATQELRTTVPEDGSDR